MELREGASPPPACWVPQSPHRARTASHSASYTFHALVVFKPYPTLTKHRLGTRWLRLSPDTGREGNSARTAAYLCATAGMHATAATWHACKATRLTPRITYLPHTPRRKVHGCCSDSWSRVGVRVLRVQTNSSQNGTAVTAASVGDVYATRAMPQPRRSCFFDNPEASVADTKGATTRAATTPHCVSLECGLGMYSAAQNHRQGCKMRDMELWQRRCHLLWQSTASAGVSFVG